MPEPIIDLYIVQTAVTLLAADISLKDRERPACENALDSWFMLSLRTASGILGRPTKSVDEVEPAVICAWATWLLSASVGGQGGHEGYMSGSEKKKDSLHGGFPMADHSKRITEAAKWRVQTA